MTDPSTRLLLSIADAEDRIGNAWLAQYRGTGWISKLIQYGTGGPYSHSAMLRKDSKHVDVLELREFIGGRSTPLEAQVARWPGMIDVFSPDYERWPLFDSVGAVEVMRHLTGREYGYTGVARLALAKVPLLWRCWPLETDEFTDVIENTGAPFCSHAVCSACRIGGGVDPCPRKADARVTPNDLTWSLFFKYEFTLAN